MVFRKLFSRQSLSSPAPYDVLAEGVVVGRIFKPNAAPTERRGYGRCGMTRELRDFYFEDAEAVVFADSLDTAVRAIAGLVPRVA